MQNPPEVVWDNAVGFLEHHSIGDGIEGALCIQVTEVDRAIA
jgi:hypothetical protein